MLAVLLVLGLMIQGAPDVDGWTSSAPKSNAFRVVMPPNPTEAVVAGSTAPGQVTRSLSATDGDLTDYSVSWTEYQTSPVLGRSPKSVFEAVRNALVSTTGRRLVARADVPVGGSAGEEFVLQAPDRQLTLIRVAVIGNTFYQLTASARSERDLTRARRFVESFSVSRRD
jgi:hypothetical protein